MASQFKVTVQNNSAPSQSAVDIALASTSESGIIAGELNSFVLRDLGYHKNHLSKGKDYLKKDGYFWLEETNKKPILLIVTVGKGSPETLLRRNLTDALQFNQEKLKGKSIWVPLMGTGVGQISPLDSFEIISEVFEKVLQHYHTPTTFIISLPKEIKRDQEDIIRLNCLKWTDNIRIKHALSTNNNDPALTQKGYLVQGRIGYIYLEEREKTTPLHQAYLRDFDDYFYYVNRKNEKFSNHQVSEEKIIGYLSLKSDRDDLELKRFFRKVPSWDHFYSPLPNEKRLRHLGYKEEPKDFTGKYLMPTLVKGATELYIYSKDVETKLFSTPSLDHANQQKLKSIDELQHLIESNISENKTFWWATYAERLSGNINSGLETDQFFIKPNKGVSTIPKQGELVILANISDKYIDAIFQIEKTENAHYPSKRIFTFKTRTKFSDLLEIDLLQSKSFESKIESLLIDVPSEIFQEIVNTTEVGLLSAEYKNPSDFYKQSKREICWWLNLSIGRASDDFFEITISEEFDATGISNGQSIFIFDHLGETLTMGSIEEIFYPASQSKNSPNGLIIKKQLTSEEEIGFDELKYNEKLSNYDLSSLEGVEVSKISPVLFNAVLDTIKTKQIRSLTPDDLAVYSSKSKIAKQIADLDKGEDYLGIDRDVTAFAKVIASDSFNPPLAIALFGQWGAGKSFFMNKLRDKIEHLSDSGKNEYRSGIAHIHFNAWSYLDANLWASIVTKIFEGLNEYIGGDTKANKNKKKIAKELNNKLNVLKDERNHYEHQKVLNQKKIKELKHKEGNAEEELKKKIDSVKKASLDKILKKVDKEFQVGEKLSEAIASNQSKIQSLDEIKKVVPEEYWKNPELALKEAKSAKVFIHEFFNQEKIGRNVFWLVFILLIIAIVPKILYEITPWLKNEFIILPQLTLSAVAFITPIWKRFKVVYDKIQPIIASFWTLKQEYYKAVEAAKFSHNQLMDSIKIEIDQRKIEVQMLSTQISELQTEIKGLDYKLEHTLSTQTLYSFIERRAKGDTYKKHLGIISTIRNDFEVLSDLFDGSQEESKNEQFRNYFDKPLERIVLYIDDLDRCSEEQVVEVLEAVNLLMAFPLFVVVVGVDPRWVKNALTKKYELQFGETNSNSNYKHIEATDYLEKIFQVPFHLEEASDEAVKNMLKELSKPGLTEDIDAEIDKADKDDFDYLVDGDGSRLEDSDGSALVIRKPSISVIETSDSKDSEVIQNDEHLSLSTQEIELIQDVSGIIGSNPRAVKRFVNVYQIVRAHEGLPLNQNNSDYLILMFLLAFPMGECKMLFKDFHTQMCLCAEEGKSTTLGQYIKMSKKDVDDIIGFKKNLNYWLSSTPSLKILKDTKLEDFAYKNKFIQRFTFSDLI